MIRSGEGTGGEELGAVFLVDPGDEERDAEGARAGLIVPRGVALPEVEGQVGD